MQSKMRRAVSIVFAALLLAFPTLGTASNRTVIRVAVDPSDSSIVYAASNQGIFKSINAGESWTEISDGLPPHPSISEVYPGWEITLDVRALAVDPTNPQIVYAGIVPVRVTLRDGGTIVVGGGTFKSTDGGERWTTASEKLSSWDLVVDPTDPETVYGVVRFATGFFIKTTTGGEYWLAQRLVQFLETIFLDVGDSNALYAAARGDTANLHRVFKSIDGGSEWFEIPFPRGDSEFAPRFAADPSRPGTLYGTVFSGIYRSTDSGESWSRLTGISSKCIVVDVNNPSTVYGCGPVGGVARSTDSGETWSLQREGLGPAYVESLAVDPNDSSTLYVGAYSLGTGAIFKSTDGGDSWFDVGPQ